MQDIDKQDTEEVGGGVQLPGDPFGFPIPQPMPAPWPGPRPNPLPGPEPLTDFNTVV
jgi:hypothetical protein